MQDIEFDVPPIYLDGHFPRLSLDEEEAKVLGRIDQGGLVGAAATVHQLLFLPFRHHVMVQTQMQPEVTALPVVGVVAVGHDGFQGRVNDVHKGRDGLVRVSWRGFDNLEPVPFTPGPADLREPQAVGSAPDTAFAELHDIAGQSPRLVAAPLIDLRSP